MAGCCLWSSFFLPRNLSLGGPGSGSRLGQRLGGDGGRSGLIPNVMYLTSLPGESLSACGLQEKTVSVERYRILSSLLALVLKDGINIAHLVPEGTTVTANRRDSERFVNVEWDGNKAVMRRI